jgi:hypothetical protein
MKSGSAAARWRGVVCTATMLAVLTGACSSSGSNSPADPEPDVPVTTQVPPTPESLRGELVAAIAARDEDALRFLWPASSWDTIGTDVLADFEVSSEGGDCDRLSAIRAHCYVFEQDVPFVLGLTMELTGAGSWRINSVTLDSTH